MSSAHPSNAMRAPDYWRRYPVETSPDQILGMLKRVPFSSTGEDLELLMFESGTVSPTVVISPGSAGHAFVFAELGYCVCERGYNVFIMPKHGGRTVDELVQRHEAALARVAQMVGDRIRTLVDALYRRADWPWACAGGATVTHGWKPESGFLPYGWEGYDEAMLLYALGLGSPTYPLPTESYAACENSRRATYVQQSYAIRNPLEFVGYGQYFWGLTASDGPGWTTQRVRGIGRTFFDYVARGAPYGPDDGTRAMGCGRLAPVRPRYRAADRSALSGRLPTGYGRILPPVQLQPDLSARGRYRPRLDVAVPLRDQPRSGRVDVRELPVGAALGVDARVPYVVTGLRRAGFTNGWL